MPTKPEVFDSIPNEFVVAVDDVAAAANSRIGCMKWVRNEPGFSVWVSDAPISCCCWVHEGLTRIQLNIPHGQELHLRNGQGLTSC